MLPSEYVNLSHEDKVFIIASIQVKAEDRKKEIEEAERRAK